MNNIRPVENSTTTKYYLLSSLMKKIGMSSYHEKIKKTYSGHITEPLCAMLMDAVFSRYSSLEIENKKLKEQNKALLHQIEKLSQLELF